MAFNGAFQDALRLTSVRIGASFQWVEPGGGE